MDGKAVECASKELYMKQCITHLGLLDLSIKPKVTT